MNGCSIVVWGHLGRDPKSGSSNDKPWAIASVALGSKESVCWVKIFAQGKAAEILAEKKKGDFIMVQGKLQAAKTQDGTPCGCDVYAWTIQGMQNTHSAPGSKPAPDPTPAKPATITLPGGTVIPRIEPGWSAVKVRSPADETPF